MRASFLIALLAVPAAVKAEPDEPEWKLDNKEMRIAIRKYGDCIVRRYHVEAAKVILGDKMNSEIIKQHQRLLDGGCLPQTAGGTLTAKFPGDAMRYALAEALVRKDYATGFPPDIPFAVPLSRRGMDLAWFVPPPDKKLKPKQIAALEQQKTEALAFAFVARFGECVARADPASAHRLLLTDPTTDDETAAFRALAPALSDCLEDKAQIKANKATIRGTIARNFYRLAKAPRLAPTGAPQ